MLLGCGKRNMCVSVLICALCPDALEAKVLSSLRVRVTGVSQSPDVGARSQAQFSASALNCLSNLRGGIFK